MLTQISTILLLPALCLAASCDESEYRNDLGSCVPCGGLLNSCRQCSGSNFSLLINGSFESDAEGWSSETSVGLSSTYSAFRGSRYLTTDGAGNSFVYQDVPTVPFQSYQLSFVYSPMPDVKTKSNQVALEWNGAEVARISSNGISEDASWEVYRYTLEATKSVTRLGFRGSGTQDGVGGLIDAVVLGILPVCTACAKGYYLSGDGICVKCSIKWANCGECSDSNKELVENGGFEDVDLEGGTSVVEPKIRGWRSDRSIEVASYYSAAEGAQFLETDSDGNAFVYQEVDTEKGIEYTLSFFYSPRPGVDLQSNRVAAYWGDRELVSLAEDGSEASDTQWKRRQYKVQATDDKTSVGFKGIGTDDGLGGLIDGVSLNQASTCEKCQEGYFFDEARKCQPCAAYVPFCTECSVEGSTVLLNGSFESPLVEGFEEVVDSVKSWDSLYHDLRLIRGQDAYEGRQYIQLDSDGNAFVFQDLPTQVGQQYNVAFAYSPRPDVAASSAGVEVSWEGEPVLTTSRDGLVLASVDWKVFSFKVVAQSSPSRLGFSAIGEEDGVGALLDNVLVYTDLRCTECLGDLDVSGAEDRCEQYVKDARALTNY